METTENSSTEPVAQAANSKGAMMNVVTFANNGSVKIKNEDVIDRAYACLESHPHFRGRVSHIEINCDRSVLVLSGRLPSYFLKQILQTALRELDGISKIQNDIEVISLYGVLNDPESLT